MCCLFDCLTRRLSRKHVFAGDNDVRAEIMKLPEPFKHDMLSKWEAHKDATSYEFYVHQLPLYAHIVCERAIRKVRSLSESLGSAQDRIG